jgi:hypothetical protein
MSSNNKIDDVYSWVKQYFVQSPYIAFHCNNEKRDLIFWGSQGKAFNLTFEPDEDSQAILVRMERNGNCLWSETFELLDDKFKDRFEKKFESRLNKYFFPKVKRAQTPQP